MPGPPVSSIIEHDGVANSLKILRTHAATSAREWADEIENLNSSYGRDIAFAEARASHIIGIIMAINRLGSS